MENFTKTKWGKIWILIEAKPNRCYTISGQNYRNECSSPIYTFICDVCRFSVIQKKNIYWWCAPVYRIVWYRFSRHTRLSRQFLLSPSSRMYFSEFPCVYFVQFNLADTHIHKNHTAHCRYGRAYFHFASCIAFGEETVRNCLRFFFKCYTAVVWKLFVFV